MATTIVNNHPTQPWLLDEPPLTRVSHEAIQLAIYQQPHAYVARILNGTWTAAEQQVASTALRERVTSYLAHLEHQRRQLNQRLQTLTQHLETMDTYAQIQEATEALRALAKTYDRCHVSALGQLTMPARPPATIEQVSLEYPLYRSKDFKVGNIDVLIEYRGTSLQAGSPCLTPFDADWRPGYVVQKDPQPSVLEFECKSRITDIGELIRQLRDHGRPLRTMFAHVRQCVVSPDTRARDILVDQGFDFLTYEVDASP